MKPRLLLMVILPSAALVAALLVCALPHVPWRTLLTSSRPDPQIAAEPISLSRDVRVIRVNVTPTARRVVKIAVDGPFKLRTLDDSKLLSTKERLHEFEVTHAQGKFRIGNETFSASQLEIDPRESPAIWVNGHQYRGRLRLYAQSDGRITAVNVLPLEEYLASVVDSEMPIEFGRAAREAQAIAARTYAVSRMLSAAGHPRFDLDSSTRSQKYLGFQYRDGQRRLAGESADSRQIVRNTADLVCTEHGRPFCAYYSAVCGGKTTPGKDVFADSVDLLQSVPCSWCGEAPRHRWTVRISKANATRDLQQYFADRNANLQRIRKCALVAGQAPAPGALFELSDGNAKRRVAAATLRRLLSCDLPSPIFAVRDEGDNLVFEGRGHGHGVGLCQWGARGMAKAGKSTREIIEHYYPGADIAPLNFPAETPRTTSLASGSDIK